MRKKKIVPVEMVHRNVDRYLEYDLLPELEKKKIRQEYVNEHKQGAQTIITVDDRQQYFWDWLGSKVPSGSSSVAPVLSAPGSASSAHGVTRRKRRKSTKKRKPRKKKSVKKRKGKSKKKRVRRGRKTRRKVTGGASLTPAGAGVSCMFFFKTPSKPNPSKIYPNHIKMTFQRASNSETVTGFSVLYFNNNPNNRELILEARPTIFGKSSDLDFNVKHGGNIIGQFKKKNANDKHGSLTITGKITVNKINLLLKNKDGKWDGYDPALLPRHMEPDTFTNPKTEEEILRERGYYSSGVEEAAATSTAPAATTITGPGASAAAAGAAAEEEKLNFSREGAPWFS